MVGYELTGAEGELIEILVACLGEPSGVPIYLPRNWHFTSAGISAGSSEGFQVDVLEYVLDPNDATDKHHKGGIDYFRMGGNMCHGFGV